MMENKNNNEKNAAGHRGELLADEELGGVSGGDTGSPGVPVDFREEKALTCEHFKVFYPTGEYVRCSNCFYSRVIFYPGTYIEKKICAYPYGQTDPLP